MVDMGLNAIQNVANIVAFLKIDEVRNLIITQESGLQGADLLNKTQNEVEPLTKETQQQEIEKLN
jgi:hypothetical protein